MGMDYMYYQGQTITVTGSIDLEPYATIKPGETGRVVSVFGDGTVDIQLDRHHPGLELWRNCMTIIPHGDTTGIEANIAID
jgi:hypothetical protein